MSIQRPTLNSIAERIKAGFQARLTAIQLRRSNATVYSRVMAGISHELHGRVEYYARQILADTAEGEWLERHAAKYGITRKGASKAAGSVAFSFSAQAVDIPIGTILQASNGIQYETISDAVNGVASVRALIAGNDGDLANGESLTLSSPIVGVMSSAVSKGIVGGDDEEDDESLRARIKQRENTLPMGGSKDDYERWALSVPGVTRAWCYPLENGDGTVVVRFVTDNEESIIPTAEKVKEVDDYIQSVKPATAKVTVVAPIEYPIRFTFSTLSPDDELTRAQIKSELESLFLREAEPGAIVLLSHLRAAVSAASGETDYAMDYPSTNILPPTGYIPTLGEIQWPI